MFTSSNRILRNKRFLEAIHLKVQGASCLHSCNAHPILVGRRILDNERRLVIDFKSIYSARLISISIENLLSTTDTALTEPVEKVSNVFPDNKVSSSSSQNVQNTSPHITSASDSDTQETVQPDKALTEFPIPEPPTPSVLTQSVPDTLNALTTASDPPFDILGLGGWSPVGLIQHGFEYLHNGLGLPWWECIFLATIIARSALFPVLVISQRNTTKLSNNMPRFQELQVKVNEAKQRGENIEAARYTQDLLLFMKEKKINPLKNMIIPFVQGEQHRGYYRPYNEPKQFNQTIPKSGHNVLARISLLEIGGVNTYCAVPISRLG